MRRARIVDHGVQIVVIPVDEPVTEFVEAQPELRHQIRGPRVVITRLAEKLPHLFHRQGNQPLRRDDLRIARDRILQQACNRIICGIGHRPDKIVRITRSEIDCSDAEHITKGQGFFAGIMMSSGKLPCDFSVARHCPGKMRKGIVVDCDIPGIVDYEGTARYDFRERVIRPVVVRLSNWHL
ncbi:hypothetical protein D3C80_1176560 [compost metagenome]